MWGLVRMVLLFCALGFACFIVMLYFCRTFKQECASHISLRANEDGTALVIRSVCFDHNHEISQV